MHRSRLPVLVILAAAAACSRHDASEGTAILSEDRTLVARLDVDQETHKATLPAACGTIAIPAQPAVANQHQADELTRQARDAEMHGDVDEARSLFRRAVGLDATNKSAAYHLGRTSEALGDSSAAMSAYCRYLALTPTTAEAVEAHQRVAKLSQAKIRVAAGSAIDSTTTARSTSTGQRTPAATVPRVSRDPATVARRAVASTTVARSVPATPRERSASSTIAAASGQHDTRTPREPATPAAEAARATSDSSAAAGDVVMTSSREPAVEQPAPAPRTTSRYPTRAQSAGIGAVAGAILGGATGRSMKSAVIGAAAGGLLGTMVGRTPSRPVGRGIVPWAGT